MMRDAEKMRIESPTDEKGSVKGFLKERKEKRNLLIELEKVKFDLDCYDYELIKKSIINHPLIKKYSKETYLKYFNRLTHLLNR